MTLKTERMYLDRLLTDVMNRTTQLDRLMVYGPLLTAEVIAPPNFARR